LITNIGKNILAKYLVGQTQAYASFIAIGVGAKPLSVGETFPDFSEQESLDFEVLRMPITSRGFVYNENGEPNIVFLAEIPSDQRYAITEVGVYPGRANPSAGGLDSRMLYTFTESENWEYHTETAAVGINTIVAPLNLSESSGRIAVPDVVFRTNSNNTVFSGPLRAATYERPRFLDRTMMLRGDLSFLTVSNGSLQLSTDPSPYPGSHIHYNGISVDLDQTSSQDELRLAFSVLSKDETESQITVSSVRILVEFVDSDVAEPTTFARFEVIKNQTDADVDFPSNRYFVVNKKIEELTKSANFTWSAINSVRVYATVLQTGQTTPSENFYISLDGLRFENTTIKNPLYGLTGYSPIKTLDGRPVVKESNTSNSVEFRFGLDVA
jgi:hypothetical protein